MDEEQELRKTEREETSQNPQEVRRDSPTLRSRQVRREEFTLESQDMEMIEEIIRGIHPSWNNLYKSLYVYIELERRLDGKNSSSISRIYKTILDRLEIPNRLINGIEDYAWNEIEIDGEFYPVDLSADVEYYNSPASEGLIGVCNFAVNREFYNNPNHRTLEVSKHQKLVCNTLPEETINEALKGISTQYQMARVTERPTIRLQSKELSAAFGGGEITRENVGNVRSLVITLTDSDVAKTAGDLAQIATYYPELLTQVQLERTGSSVGKEAMQTVLDEVCEARKIAKSSPVASHSFEIVISGSDPDDFDLDYSRLEDAIIPGTPIDSTTEARGTKLSLRNTSTGSFRLPNISSRLGGVSTLSIQGMDIGNLSLIGSRVRRLEASGPNTINISSVRGLDTLAEIQLNGVSEAEANAYLAGPYRTSSNLFLIQLDRINFRGRPILQELRRGNPNVSNVMVRYANLDNLDGIEEFRDELYDLNLYGNDLGLADLERLNRFYARYYEPTRRPLPVYLSNNPRIETEARAVGGISRESLEYLRDIIINSDSSFTGAVSPGGIPDIGGIVEVMFFEPDIPYYLKDAKRFREDLKVYRNPIMIENESELDTTNFNEAHLNGATLLLTIPQLEHLINSGKTIPQNIRIKIESAADLDLATLEDLRNRAAANGLHLTEVAVFDKSQGNGRTQISPYTLSQYAYIRETLDILTNDIDPSEPDIDKFATIYIRLAEAIKYNLESCGDGKVDRAHAKYYAERINNCRNMFDGLHEWQCVCAGYADILRNALAMVGIDARIVSNNGHAWNQVLINGKWYSTDLTWDRQRDRDASRRDRFDWMLKGNRTFNPHHDNVKTKNVEHVEDDDYPLTELHEAIRRAKQRNFDLMHSRDPIAIPPDPIRVIALDRKKIQGEYQRRLDDMYAKYYGDRDYEREYRQRSERFKSHQIVRQSVSGIRYLSIDNYPERAEDEKFLQLEQYRAALERVTKYQGGDTSVYSGTPEEISKALQRDREYIKTRNYTFNQHEHTRRDLATLGKYGERMPYIPRQDNFFKNVGRVVLNTAILARNIVAPVYRGIGRFVAQPIHRLVTGKRDASPYRNNAYHRMVARRDYFLEEARKRDEAETEARRARAVDPSKVKPVRHPIRNILEARHKAVFQAKKGNEAVLRAGAADIRRNIQAQEGEAGWVLAARKQVADLRKQINELNQELAAKPYAANRREVEAAIQSKRNLMAEVEKKLSEVKIVTTEQNDAVSNDQHAIASKEVNTLRVTAIKGVIKCAAIRFVGPKIHDWLAQRAIKTREVPSTERVREKTSTWVATTYKDENVPTYADVLDTGKSMSDIMGRNTGKQVTGFYSVWGGERRPAVYNLTGNERITAVFRQIGGGGKGFSDTAGLRAPVLTDGTFPQELLDGSGFLRQDISLEELLNGLNISPQDVGALDGIYVSIGDRYWTSLGNLVQGMTKQVQTGTIPQRVIDVAGHYEETTRWVRRATTKTEEYVDQTIQTAVNIGEGVAKGAVAVDTLQDVFENARNTTTNQPKNKKGPRRYTHTDSDLGKVPTSRKEYRQRHTEDEER